MPAQREGKVERPRAPSDILEAVLSDLSGQRVPMEAEDSGRLADLAGGEGQDVRDVTHLHVAKRLDRPGAGRRRFRAAPFVG